MLWGFEGCIFEIYQLGILFHSFFNFEGFRQHMNLQIILMILNKMYPNPKNNSITSKRKYSYHAKSWTGDFPAYISGCLIKCSIHQTARSKGLVIWSFITDPIAERNNELHSLYCLRCESWNTLQIFWRQNKDPQILLCKETAVKRSKNFEFSATDLLGYTG